MAKSVEAMESARRRGRVESTWTRDDSGLAGCVPARTDEEVGQANEEPKSADEIRDG
jgi:hypothetical protein